MGWLEESMMLEAEIRRNCGIFFQEALTTGVTIRYINSEVKG